MKPISADTLRKIEERAFELWHDSAMGDYLSQPDIKASLLSNYINGDWSPDDERK